MFPQEGLFWRVHRLLDPLHCAAHSALDRPRRQTSVLHGSRSREVRPCSPPTYIYIKEPGAFWEQDNTWKRSRSLESWTVLIFSPAGFWCRSPSSRPTGPFPWCTRSTRSSSCATTRRCSWWTPPLLMCLWLRWTTRERSPWVRRERTRANLEPPHHIQTNASK